MRRTIVFDLDGTLVDSAADIRDALNRVLAEEGRRPVTLDEARNMIGDGMDKVVERGFEATGSPPSPEALSRHFQRYREVYRTTEVVHTRPYRGVTETLRYLKETGHKLAVCTNKLGDFAVEILDALELDGFFAAVVGADSTPARKPDPAPLRAAIERLGSCVEDAVMVGDGPVDVAVARAAGVPVVAVTYGYARMAPSELGADLLITRFEGLVDALAQLRSPQRSQAALRKGASLTAPLGSPYTVARIAGAAPQARRRRGIVTGA
jgi:phosphoglycolate phosphatase